MKYQRPSKMGHNKGRNPEYETLSSSLHKPLKRALKTKRKAYYAGERVSLMTVLAEEALFNNFELQALYDKELERKDGDGKV